MTQRIREIVEAELAEWVEDEGAIPRIAERVARHVLEEACGIVAGIGDALPLTEIALRGRLERLVRAHFGLGDGDGE